MKNSTLVKIGWTGILVVAIGTGVLAMGITRQTGLSGIAQQIISFGVIIVTFVAAGSWYERRTQNKQRDSDEQP